MARSILKSILEDRINSKQKQLFLEKVSTQNRISYNALLEVYDNAISETTSTNAITIAKSKVYTYIKTKTINEARSFGSYQEFIKTLVAEYIEDEIWFNAELDGGSTPPDSYLPDVKLHDSLDYYYAEELEKFGVSKNDVAKDVTASLGSSIHETDSDDAVYYRVWNYRKNIWAGKPTTNLTAARRRVDKLDNDYGAYSYRVTKVDSRGNKLEG